MDENEEKNEQNSLDDLLDEEIKREFEILKTLEPGTVEWEELTNSLQNLCRIRMDCVKIGAEFEDRDAQRLHEKELKEIDSARDEAKLQEAKKARRGEIIKDLFLGATGVGLPLLAYRHMFKEGMRFEQTGTYTSSTFKNLIKYIRPTKP